MIRTIGLLAGSASMSAPAFAADEHAKGGLPQLDIATYPSQIFWLIVAFGLLLWLMRTKILPVLEEILETRRARIQGDLDRAAMLREEAEEAGRRHAAVVAAAQAAAGNQLRETRDAAAAEIARRQAVIDAEIGQRLKEADARILGAKTTALGEVANVAAEVAQAAVRRLAGIEIGMDDAKAVVAGLAGEGAR